MIATNSYDEYGVPASTNTGRFQYTGQAWLPELGLYYYKARMYSPTLGRFMQTDPIGYDDGMNMYAYGGGEPINGNDPTGMWWASRLERKMDTYGNVFWGSSSGGSGRGGLRDSDGFFRYGELDRAEVLWERKAWFKPGTDEQYSEWKYTGRFFIQAGSRAYGGGRGYLGGGATGSWEKEDCGCFEARTMVATPTGLKPIEDIAVGDLVMAQEEKTGTIAPKPVTDLIRPRPKRLYALAVHNQKGEAQTYHATDDHPWKVEDKGWVETLNLKAGDRIDTASGRDLVVKSLVPTDRIAQTYNLTVADWHTFMVGTDWAVVHNACPPSQSPIWRKLNPWRGSIKRSKDRYYEYDRLHGEIEVYDKRGKHLGVMGPVSGKMISGPVKGRSIDVS